MVAKHFDEFEDLQDKAIDAILDLCEDDEERVRRNVSPLNDSLAALRHQWKWSPVGLIAHVDFL